MDQSHSLRKQQYALRSQSYVLKESISDSSSDEGIDGTEEEEKHLPMHKRRRTSTSSSLRSTSPLLNATELNSIQPQPIPLHVGNDQDDIIDITDEGNDDDDDGDFMYFSNPASSHPGSFPSISDTNEVIDISSTPVNPNEPTNSSSNYTINAAEMIPLRRRADSDLQFYREKMAENNPALQQLLTSTKHPTAQPLREPHQKGIGYTAEKETPERWRNRLWPGKAIIAYCRIITRCKPPNCKPGERLNWTKDAIKAHWRENEMHKVGVYFDNVMMHSSAFFLLTVEESRAAVSNSDDLDQPLFTTAPEGGKATITSTKDGTDSSNEPIPAPASETSTIISAPTPATNYYETIGNHGWLDCEIIGIVGESEFGSLPQACDPTLGSVWIVSVAIKTPNIRIQESSSNANTNTKGSNAAPSSPLPPRSKSSSHLAKESSLAGGDLVVMHSNQWNHSMLGLIQPWDPDYDLKFGVNFHANPSQHTRYLETFYNDHAADLTMANILICVDSGENTNINSTSSNTNQHQDNSQNKTNSVRETGGWASQGTIYPGVTFSMAIIGNVMTYIRECQALMSLKLLNTALRDAVLKPYRSPSSSLSAEGLYHPDGAPKTIPSKLWHRLSEEYNDSQLKAIRTVCQPSSSVCLLQGPPGSGKTKTILGVLSVLLAGALRPPQKTTKVIAGSSFRTDQKTSNEYSEIVGRRSRSNSVASDHGGSHSHSHSHNSSSGIHSSLPGGLRSLSSGDRPRVLVCAPSNTAVDELVFRILTQGIYDGDGYKAEDINIVRIGLPTLLKESHFHNKQQHQHHQHTTTNITAPTTSIGLNYAAPLTEEDYNVLKLVERVSLENIVEDRRRALLASDAKKQLGISFKYADIRKQILEKADIVCCTLSGAGSQPILEVILRITGYKFDAVIIDEAAQAVEPSSLIPFKYNPQLVVLVGDPCQLPATVFSRIAKEANYGQSLFLRLQKLGHPVTMLQTQYRMHPIIAQYPSIRFYSNRLFTDPSVNAHTTHYKPYHDDPSGRFRPFLFHDLLYSYEENDGPSIRNRLEAHYILALYEELVQQYPNYRKNIGIIAPYRAQRRYLLQIFYQKYGYRHSSHHHRNSLKGSASTSNNNNTFDTEIATVDGFQGREKDIIIFSCVRSQAPTNSSSGVMGGNANPGFDSIGFLREWQRLNVAITRAKYALWIVGNSKTLQKDVEWNELIAYTRRQGFLLSFPTEKSAMMMNANTSHSHHRDRQDHHNNRHKKKNKKHKKRHEHNRSRSPPPPQQSQHHHQSSSK